MRRRVLSVTAAAALVASAALTGCSSGGSAESSCVAPFAPGALSDSVRVSGDSADTLKVSFDEGAQALNTQRSIAGTTEPRGRVLTEGMIASANFAYVDGVTGETLDVAPTFGTDRAGTLFPVTSDGNSIVTGVICSAVGDTVVTVLSPEESTTMGIADGSLIVVAQIVQAYDTRATGASRALPAGFPAVTNDSTGRPGVVLPPQQAPAELRVAPRIEGTGALVTAEDLVVGNVLTVGWDGRQLKNTWAEGPQSFGAEADMEQSGVSFRAALTGFPIGSQIVVIDPSGDQPRVSVIDILAVA